MGRTKKPADNGQAGPSKSKRARTPGAAAVAAAAAAAPQPQLQQRGIAAAFAAHGSRPTTDLVLEHEKPHDQLERRLTDELNRRGQIYLQAWADKCYGMRGEAAGGGKSKGSGGSLRARRATAAASFSKEDTDLDLQGINFIEGFRHLMDQAFKHDAGFDPKLLELLVLILRSDVVHSLGEVSHQAYCLLRAYHQHFPYASLRHFDDGEYAGRPYLLKDEWAVWQPLAAAIDPRGLTRRYIMEEAIKDAGHNHRVDNGAGMAGASRKKGGLMGSVLKLLHLCFDRAVDSVDEDYNGDVLLLRYLLVLLQQDLGARLEVFSAYGDVENEAVQGRRFAVLQNSLLWRIWLDETEDDNLRRELMELVMKLIVGVASEEDLQDVDEEHHQLDKEAEAAEPCICTPRELAALAARFLNMLLDMFGTAEAAGGFASTAANRMHRLNQRLKLDQAMKELFWKKPAAVCLTDDSSRTFLAALAPPHRLRLLSLIPMEQIGRAYYAEEAQDKPVLRRAKQLEAQVKTADSGDGCGAFPADPLLAVRCLNFDRSRSIKVFTNVGGGSPIDNLAVISCGIAQAALRLRVAGCELPIDSEGGEGGEGTAGLQQLQQELREFLGFLADRHREVVEAGKAAEMSRASLIELAHAQAALTLF